MQSRVADTPDVHSPATCAVINRDAVSAIDQQQFHRPQTIAEIDERIATGRQRYIAAYFAGEHGEAQFWVHEIARLENWRHAVQRRAVSR